MKTTATPSTVRFLNRRSVIRYLLSVPALSRADLAKAVGMSPVTAGKIVDDLVSERILETVKSPKEITRVGRPGNLVQLDQTRPRFLTIQLGVTHTRATMVPLGYRGNDEWAVEFNTPDSARQWVEMLSTHAAPQLQTELWGILISVGGIVDEPARRVLYSPNLHWTEVQDFSALLRPYNAAPVLLAQEIQALALGELANRPEIKDFLLVDFSHGLGGAAIIGGNLHKTQVPLNSELGHTRVAGNRRRCGCGGVGCVETLVSRRGLFQSLGLSGKYRWDKVIQHVQEHGLEPWLKESLSAAASSIGAALNVLGLQHVSITGSINELPAEAREFLANEIRNASLWERFGHISVTFSPRHRVRGLIKFGLESLLMTARE